MMRTNVNYYALLGVSSTATPDEITRAFRKRILEVHLDKQPQGEDSDLCYKTIEAHRVLSDRNLRIKYDIEFGAENKQGETFIPAGYICYDVGEDRLSTKVLQNIANWKEEFERINSTGSGFSDNYFSCISTLMNEVVNEQSPEKPAGFFCEVCDKHFMTPEHHWEQVISPYISMFSCDKSGVDSLFQYYETVLTSEAFSWKPSKLPTQLFGIWASGDWDKILKCDKVLVNIFLDIPTTITNDDVEELINYIEETFINDDDIDEDVFPKVASEILCWVLEHQDSQEDVTERILELIASKDVVEILYFVSAMKNFLDCKAEEWTGLVSDALEAEELELAMVWTKIAIGFQELPISEWFDLGMKIYPSDPVLAHICFMNGQCNENDQDWEYIANEFTKRKKHFAAAEYHLNFSKGGLDRLIQKSKLLQKTDRKGAKLYKNIYYSAKIKFLLTNLSSPESMSTFRVDLKTLIELTEDLTPNCNWNCLEGFKIIVNTWPTEFDETHCLGIHRSTLDNILVQQNLKYLNVKSYNIVLAAVHYLPEDEVDEEFVSEESVQLTKRQIGQSMRTSDFKSLAEILLLLTKRAIPGASEFLDNFNAEETRSHLKSMKLLISGTINKIRDQNWIGAIKDYQNALLCAPECSHLVIPCIIKLSQDIEFHSAVVDQVHSEVKNLKQLIESTGYLNIERFGSEEQSSSLIITDVAPKSTSLYKNAISKIQSEPPKEAPDPAEPVETNTPLVTLDKNEEAIESSQGLGGLNSALAYIDLLRALPLQFQPGPIVMAASHFLQAMDECETSDLASLFAYRNAIISMAENLLQIDEESQAAIQHCLTHKQMLSILICAHEKLSKAVAAEKMENQNEIGGGTEMITKAGANLISKFFKNVVNFPKVEPLASIPTLSCSDLIYVETIGNTFLNRFCFEKVNQGRNDEDFNKISKSVHAYTHFIEVWKGRSVLTDFETARVQAMKELLALKKWTLKDVENFVNDPMLSLTEEGWTSELKISLQFPNPSKSYRSIHGFRIQNGQITFLCSKETKTLGNLFDINDMHEIFSNGIVKSKLSLICPDELKQSHPFKEVNFEPSEVKKSDIPNYFKTLTRVSTLICFFASGLEVSGKAPFSVRKIEDGLIKRLPEHLQHFIRPVSIRKAEKTEKSSTSDSNILKEFCLNMTEVLEEEEEDDESGFTYKVGGVNPELSIKSTNFINETEFAQDFTKHYNEISKQFPELARLKELVKISVIHSKLKKVLEENIKLMRQNGRSKEEIGIISNICKGIKQLGIKANANAETMSKKNVSEADDCIWVPATFCNIIQPEVYDVSAGINMNPTVVYGPVNVPKNFVVVQANEFTCNNTMGLNVSKKIPL